AANAGAGGSHRARSKAERCCIPCNATGRHHAPGGLGSWHCSGTSVSSADTELLVWSHCERWVDISMRGDRVIGKRTERDLSTGPSCGECGPNESPSHRVNRLVSTTSGSNSAPGLCTNVSRYSRAI